jgi:hypothetical protein
LKSKPSYISELSFDEDWDGDTTNIAASTVTQPAEYAAIAAARRIDAPVNHPITIFYHLPKNGIDIQTVSADGGVQALGAEAPRGVPTSR